MSEIAKRDNDGDLFDAGLAEALTDDIYRSGEVAIGNAVNKACDMCKLDSINSGLFKEIVEQAVIIGWHTGRALAFMEVVKQDYPNVNNRFFERKACECAISAKKAMKKIRV